MISICLLSPNEKAQGYKGNFIEWDKKTRRILSKARGRDREGSSSFKASTLKN